MATCWSAVKIKEIMIQWNLDRRACAPSSVRLLLFTATLVAVLVSGCGTGRGDDGHNSAGLNQYFLRDVATAEAVKLPVYWLGEEFAVDDLVFRGPYGVEFGTEAEQAQQGVLEMTYLAPLKQGGNTRLKLYLYSKQAWEATKERVTNPALPGVTRSVISVAGRHAELISVPLGTRPVNTLWLLLHLDDVVVVGEAPAGGPMYPGGPDYNPFINNPDLLIQVLEENLRPYPE